MNSMQFEITQNAYGSSESELSAQNLDSEYQEWDEDEDLVYFDCKALFHSFRSLKKVDVKVRSKIGFWRNLNTNFGQKLGDIGKFCSVKNGPVRSLKYPGSPPIIRGPLLAQTSTWHQAREIQ